MVTRRIENFLRAFEKKIRLQKMPLFNRVGEVQGYGSKKPFFQGNFFSNALRKFSACRVTMFNILGRLSKVISLRSKKKSESYDTPSKLYGRKRSKSLDFEKFTFRIGLVEYRAMVQKSHFLKAKLFFQRLLENFLCAV